MHEIGWLSETGLDWGSDSTRGCATHTRKVVVIITIIIGNDDFARYFARLVGEE